MSYTVRGQHAASPTVDVVPTRDNMQRAAPDTWESDVHAYLIDWFYC